MNQIKTINQLKGIFPEVKDLYAAILYGSFARNEGNPNSDIDIQLLISDKFSVNEFKALLNDCFKGNVIRIQQVALRKKLVVYFTNQPKLEFALHTDISELKRNYLGSEIQDVKSSVLFQKLFHGVSVEEYLNRISQDRSTSKSNDEMVKEFTDKFLYEFENCSTMHQRSDGYQFYYFYNIALHTAVQLAQLSKGNEAFIFLPKRLIPKLENDQAKEDFYQLNGSLYLPEANKKKRLLLDCFYNSIEQLITPEEYEEIKQFCEFIYERDFFWNFRDPHQNNPRFQPEKIYRTATLTFFQEESRFNELLKSKQIETIIDLRADREIKESSYADEVVGEVNYVSTPWDPWNQPDWFKEKYHFGSNSDIAYRFFILGCKNEINKAIRAILDTEGAVAIHCLAGKDRTGIFFSLLHLLVGCSREELFNDYLASEVDVDTNRLEIVLDIVEEQGGIENYLLSCGLDVNQLNKLKETLTYEC